MLLDLLGRLHPLVVHLPIGILILAFVFEALSAYEKHTRLRRAVRPALLIGFVGALLACVTGFILKDEGGYNDNALQIHQILGLTTAVLTLVVFYLRKRMKTFFPGQKKRKVARIFSLFILIIILSVTGHFGGTLTHGDDYLSVALITEPQEPEELSMILSATKDHDSLIFYQDIIHPLFAARCFSCHSATKQKGELRLDKPEYILKGGKEGNVFVAGSPDSSSLYTRLLLPLDDDHHMPPSEKPQLTSTDIALIQEWIQSGATFDQRVKSLPNKERINKYLASYTPTDTSPPWLPLAEVDAANEKALQSLRHAGLVILPINHESNYLMVNFTNARTFKEEWLDHLNSIRLNVVWIDLSNCAITADELKFTNRLSNLRYLYLNRATIDDGAITVLKETKSLVYLSLVGTSVTDAAVAQLKELPDLRKVFLFDTKVTSHGYRALLESKPELLIDSGNYKLEKLATDTLIFKRKL
jgi:uncharacterized membrane protein